MIHGVLLDIDGTLLDSNVAHADAYVRALAEERLDVSVERVLALIGMGNDKLLPALGVEPNSRVGARVARRKQELFTEKFLPTLKPFPAVRDLLEHMKSRGLKLVAATSAQEQELHGLLRQAHVEDLIDDHSSATDASHSKPDPDILEAAISRAAFPREELVMLGDTPYDIEAAQRASVRVVGVRSGGWSDADLDGAVAVYEDAADLLARYERSVFS